MIVDRETIESVCGKKVKTEMDVIMNTFDDRELPLNLIQKRDRKRMHMPI